MSATRIKHKLSLALLVMLFIAAVIASGAHAEIYTGPVKEIPASQIGSEVNSVTKAKVCTISSGQCQPGRPSSEAGGFEFAKGVAVSDDKASPQFGHVYVLDNTHRIHELAADGSFVSMFGWDVNKTKVEKGGATQQEMDICTQAEIEAGGECQPGARGSAPGQFGGAQTSIAVDPTSGSVYVTDTVGVNQGDTSTSGVRVQKFTADGHWVWELGKEVNQTKDGTPGATVEEKNLCTQEEVEVAAVKCTGPAQYEFGTEPSSNSAEPGVFTTEGRPVLAVGGSEGFLYVGSGERIEKFAAGGSFRGQIEVGGGLIEGLAVDNSCLLQEPVLTAGTTPLCASFDASFGDLYVIPQRGTTVEKLNATGEPLTQLPLVPRVAGVELIVRALAVDASGRLAVSEGENLGVNGIIAYGSLIDGTTDRLITEFPIAASGELMTGLTFAIGDEMYGSAHHEVVSYAPVHVAELLTAGVPCTVAAEHDTSASFDCALNGEVNPEGVENTDISFQWGLNPALGGETPVEGVCGVCGNSLVAAVPATIHGIGPNQTVYFRMVGHDQNVQEPEVLTSDTASFKTPVAPPQVTQEPSASFVQASSAVIRGELNAENAQTTYCIEYGVDQTLSNCPLAHNPCVSGVSGECPGVSITPPQDSAEFGRTGVAFEVRNLQPATEYQYRMVAENEAGQQASLQGTPFTTAATPVPHAATGPPGETTTTSAVVTGSVDPDGQPATYVFEFGVDEGNATTYEIAFSGSAGSGTEAVTRQLMLTGLQPGTTYSYRIRISSGYGTAYGAPEVFTTAGLPVVLEPSGALNLLPVPPVKFPAEPKAVKPPSNAEKLAKALKQCERKRTKRRAACRREARKKYTPSKKSKKK